MEIYLIKQCLYRSLLLFCSLPTHISAADLSSNRKNKPKRQSWIVGSVYEWRERSFASLSEKHGTFWEVTVTVI